MSMKKRLLYTLVLLFVALQTFAQSKTKYEYDELNRLTKVTYSSGTVVTYTYDDLGNRKKKTINGGYLRGDVNGDGHVNSADIVELIAYLNEMTPNLFDKKAADANADGEIDGYDADAIAEIIMTTP